jgi:hypothetical protein
MAASNARPPLSSRLRLGSLLSLGSLLRSGAVVLPVALAAITTAGCVVDDVPKPREPKPPEDEWASIEKTPEWLYVTRGFGGGRAAECKHVATWVSGESECRTRSCVHGRDLAKEWLARCKKLDEDEVPMVGTIYPRFLSEAKEAPTPCYDEAEQLLREGCRDAAVCRASGERWAARCAKPEGSPLTVKMLDRRLAEKEGDAHKPLDATDCGDLRKQLNEAAKCAHPFACQEAKRTIVEPLQKRCESDTDRPTVSIALLEASILARADGRPVELPFATAKADVLTLPPETPLLFEDQKGAVVATCKGRPEGLTSYLAQRKECIGDKIIFARVMRGKTGPALKTTVVTVPPSGNLATDYPALAVKDEKKVEDEQLLPPFEEELDKAGKASPADGLRILAKAVNVYSASLHRSTSFTAALTRHDVVLQGVLREIGKAKVAAAKSAKLKGPALIGFASRSSTRAFADLEESGAVRPGARLRLSEFNTTQLLVSASERYDAALKPLLAQARRTKIDKKTVELLVASGKQSARRCGTGLKAARVADENRLQCLLDACDGDKQAAAEKSVEDTRSGVDAARLTLDGVFSALANHPDARDELVSEMGEAECTETWWK